MNSPRVITHGGVTLNLATIKCFKTRNNIDSGKKNTMYVEHKARIEFVLNPETESFEKIEFNEITEVEYPSYEQTKECVSEWEEIWQDYLDEQG